MGRPTRPPGSIPKSLCAVGVKRRIRRSPSKITIANVSAADYVAEIIGEAGKLRVAILELLVEFNELFIARLELFFGRFKLFVCTSKFLHARENFFCSPSSTPR